MVPDDIGHLVGWVPVDPSLRMHVWHLSVVDLNRGEGLFLSEEQPGGPMKIHRVKLEDLLGKTFELIGTNVNANPYGTFMYFMFCIYSCCEKKLIAFPNGIISNYCIIANYNN